MQNRSISRYQGVTLLELIVAVGLFTVTVTLAMSGVVKVLDMNKKIRTMQVSVNNFNYSLEAMTRDIRFGREYTCDAETPNPSGKNCLNGAEKVAVAFTSPASGVDQIIAYRLDNKRIMRCATDSTSCSNDDWVPITSQQVDVTNLQFYVDGAEADGRHPRITIHTAGTVGSGAFETDFSIQTTVNQHEQDTQER